MTNDTLKQAVKNAASLQAGTPPAFEKIIDQKHSTLVNNDSMHPLTSLLDWLKIKWQRNLGLAGMVAALIAIVYVGVHQTAFQPSQTLHSIEEDSVNIAEALGVTRSAFLYTELEPVLADLRSDYILQALTTDGTAQLILIDDSFITDVPVASSTLSRSDFLLPNKVDLTTISYTASPESPNP